MRRNKKNLDELLKRHLGLFKRPTESQPDTTREDLLRRILSQATQTNGQDRTLEMKGGDYCAATRSRRSFLPYRIAVLAVILLGILSVGLLRFPSPDKVYALVVETEGPVYRVANSTPSTVTVGDRIELGTPVRTDTGAGAVLKLPDGSRIKVHAKSELALERVSDGVRVLLNDGSVTVRSSREQTTSLYVQNREVTVRVPPAQSAEATESTFALPAGRLAFEVASIKPEAAPPRDQVLTAELTGFSCTGIDGVRRAPLGQLPNPAPLGRCAGRMVNLSTLIGYAYDIYPRRVLHVPDWREAGQPLDWGFQIDAKADEPEITTISQLKEMLRTLLDERFKLRFHRDTTECQGFTLSLGKTELKLKTTPDGPEPPHTTAQSPEHQVLRGKSSMEELANALSGFVGAPVADRTKLEGIFEYSLSLHRVFVAPLNPPRPRDGGSTGVCNSSNTVRGVRQNQAGDLRELAGYAPPVPKAVEDQFGLRMERDKVLVETIIVDHAEKPSAN